jgi:hypothetical protein
MTALTRLEEAWSDQQSSEESSLAICEPLWASPDDAAGSSELSDCVSAVLTVAAGWVPPDWSPDEAPVWSVVGAKPVEQFAPQYWQSCASVQSTPLYMHSLVGSGATAGPL